MHYNVGDRVRLSTPGNPRLDGAPATVVSVEPWGVHVRTDAAATGRYRAAWAEVVPVPRGDGYEGTPCDTCGALTLRRNGACLLCDSCGATSGCS